MIIPIFFHPDDWEYLNGRSSRYIDRQSKNFADFIESDRFGDFTDRRFHLSLLPIPFLGNLSHSDIIILLLNPGFHFADYWAEEHSAEFRCRLMANLRQDFDAVDFPFLCLDPQFCWHPGFNWWEGKLRNVITAIAKDRFDGRYRDALRDLAQRLAAIELVPYRSQSFDAYPLIKQLPSVAAAKRYVRQTLVPAAERGEKTIIVTRRATDWGLDGSNENICVYTGGHTRGASLSCASKGGQAILCRYGIVRG